MKVANIVSRDKINVSVDINVVQSMDEIIHGLPTLLVGWDFVKKNYPEYNIIDRKLGPNLYWTFKKTEKREIHEEDIFFFTENAYKHLIHNVQYIFIDPILFKRSKIKKILRKIDGIDKLYAYTHGNMIYLFGDNLIFGIDIKLIEYIGLNTNKMLNKIKQKCYIFLDKKDIFIEYKSRVEILNDEVKYIPLLYSIEHG